MTDTVRDLPDQAIKGSLSGREREVVVLVATGHTNKEIARRLQLSTKTAEKHRANAMKKLGIHKIALLTLYAVKQGWVMARTDPPPSPSGAVRLISDILQDQAEEIEQLKAELQELKSARVGLAEGDD